MYLKKAVWSDGLSAESEVGEIVNSLMEQRVYGEVTLALRTALRDARAEFSFHRLRGLTSLLNFLRSLAHSNSTIHFFSLTQSIPDLQEPEDESVTNLDHIFGVDPLKITTPSTDAELSLALRVLEGCCLLHKESTVLSHHYKGIQVLMNIISTRGVLEQGACLDALISIMLDSSLNQMDFEACNGIEEVAELIRDKQVEENLSLKCGEFLLLLIGHVNGRGRPPLASIQEDIRRLLGEKSASLIWAASQLWLYSRSRTETHCTSHTSSSSSRVVGPVLNIDLPFHFAILINFSN